MESESESMADLLSDQGQMGETAVSNPVLEVSVSFGRFENEKLSWEKWSAFSPNKYLEEVEKCATPGSVAQKKAYFEAHYKKIAAKKAEELQEQEKKIGDDSMRVEDFNGGDLIDEISGVKSDFDESKDLGFIEEIKEERNLNDEGIEINGDVENKELDVKSDSFEMNKSEEADLGKEVESNLKELPQSLENQTKIEPEAKEDVVKLDHAKESKKVTPVNKERNIVSAKKKPIPSISKSPQISTPRVSKSISSSTTPPSRSLTKKGSDSSLLRRKNPSGGERKKVAPGPKSLHMSLSLSGSKNSEPASLTTTRKSLIMEKMGDKDIVKRAFKTFQNSLNQIRPSSEERSTNTKQAPFKGTEPRISTITPRKENEGRSPKTGGLNNRSAKAVPSSFGSKSDDRAEKRKEFSKRSELKSSAKEAERMRFQSKSKEQKETEIKKMRKSLNFKATPLPGFYGAQRMSKSTISKNDSKNGIQR